MPDSFDLGDIFASHEQLSGRTHVGSQRFNAGFEQLGTDPKASESINHSSRLEHVPAQVDLGEFVVHLWPQ